MKFVFFGYDFSLNALMRLVMDGHELIALYTFPCDGVFSHNTQIKMFAESLNIVPIEGKITSQQIDSLIAQGAQAFIAFGYKYKIPPVDPKKAYAINVHPALLPRVRGIMPMPFILLKEPKAAGITVHKMTQKYDAGDILYQEPFPVDESTDIEVLSSRCALAGAEILSAILKDFTRYWKQAKPQNEKLASEYAEPGNDLRTFDWKKPVKELLRTNRAFGHYGCLAFVDGKKLIVTNCNGWEEKHGLDPGTIACILPYELIIAASDGFICLKEFMILPDPA
ncbi:MAG: hypothetical protein IPH06_04130 [Alphaproteobacteria bacterium]|nr:hypothetical protein [Alphaproteobacteria bacterium]QQS57219.1 MAG: hypothetical protein IPN28_13445 [Alphaproteobacteria bacterium]